MKRVRKRAIYKAKTGEELKRSGIYFESDFESCTKLEVAKNSIKKRER